MQAGKTAFESLSRTGYDIGKECLYDLFPFNITAVTILVHQFFLTVEIADPALHIIKDAEPFIYITGMKQLIRLMPEYIPDLFSLDALHACHGRKNRGFFSIPCFEHYIVCLIFPQAFPDRVAFQPLYIAGIQINARRCIACPKVNGQRHVHLHQFPYLKIHNRRHIKIQMFRLQVIDSFVQAIDQIRLPMVHTV